MYTGLIIGCSIGLFMIFGMVILPKIVQGNANKKARNTPPVKAKVLQIEHHTVSDVDVISSGVIAIFELEDGRRVSLDVGKQHTFVEGDVGMLRYHQGTGLIKSFDFGSFEVTESSATKG